MSIPKASGPGPRRGRGRRRPENDGSNWSLVLDMPLDIMNELFLSVDHVYDLLRLSRTCRVFKEGLASPRALVNVWKPAMDRSTDLPPPLPGRLSIPQWVSLLHDRACQMPKCRSNAPLEVTHFWIQRRYCKNCYTSALLPESELRRFPWTSPHGKLVTGLTWSYCQSYAPSVWHPDDLRETDRQLAEIGEDVKKLEQFCDDRRRILTKIQKALGAPPTVYLKWIANTRAKDDHEASLQRPAEVRARLKELGYGEEEDIQALWQFNELKPSRTPFNSRSWAHLKKKLVAAVIEAREFRARHQWPILCAKRRSAIHEIYMRYRSRMTPHEFASGFFPSTYELCLSPALKARIEAPIEEPLTPEAFADLESAFPELLANEEERLKTKLTMAARLLDSGKRLTTPEVHPDHSASVDISRHSLATIVFPCPYQKSTSCKAFLFGWKDLRLHRCFPRKTGLATGIPQKDAVLLSDLSPTEEIVPHVEAGEVVKVLLRAVGMDPDTATTDDVDKLEPLVTCKTCQAAQGKHGYYSWRSFVLHVITNIDIQHDPYVYFVDQSPQMAYSRPAIFRRAIMSQREAGLWACNHCFVHIDGWRVSNFECSRHLSDKHNIRNHHQPYLVNFGIAPTAVNMFVYDPAQERRNIGWQDVPAIDSYENLSI